MSIPERVLIVTIDTEVDKDARWRVSNPPSFDSVRHGVPEVLSPLFNEFGAVPTYLLSAEVIEDGYSSEILGQLGDRAELGTHLHAEFVDPDRALEPATMAGRSADAVQCEYPRDIEAAKLTTLTDLFAKSFGRRPTSFRAGRYGLSGHTLETLAGLGYTVDSSVTPGLRWSYPQITLDYRNWSAEPTWVDVPSGKILELPVGIRPGGWPARLILRAPEPIARGARLALRGRARQRWLRPTWETGEALVRYVDTAEERLLVLMFHSMEIVPGASPYAASKTDCDRIIAALRFLLDHCVREGIAFVSLSQAVELV